MVWYYGRSWLFLRLLDGFSFLLGLITFFGVLKARHWRVFVFRFELFNPFILLLFELSFWVYFGRLLEKFWLGRSLHIATLKAFL